jgi:cell division septum initiation protein DivIVA
LQLHLLRKQLEIEASNYEGMQQELNLVNTEYEGLISQEEKLRREIEELKSYLYDYEDSTLRELEDT